MRLPCQPAHVILKFTLYIVFVHPKNTNGKLKLRGCWLPIPNNVPVFTGRAGEIAAKLTPLSSQPMTFRTDGLACAEEATLAPFYQIHHERYALCWNLAILSADAGKYFFPNQRRINPLPRTSIRCLSS